ncbi:MAG: ATP-binding protein [Vicinamibacteria bacterium]
MSSITQRMTRATVLVALAAAFFLATASGLSSRFIFEAQEERILRDSAVALSAAVRRELVEEHVSLADSAQDSIFESGLADDAIEIYKGDTRVASSHAAQLIGLSAPNVVVRSPLWLSITVAIDGDVWLVVASPRDRGERALRIFGWSLLLATPLAILVAVLIGRSAARRVTEPLVAFRDRFIAAGPGQEVGPAPSDDPNEVRELDTAFRAQWQRVRESFDREHEFAANAAHELRTPLTRMMLLAEHAAEGITNKDGRAVLDQQIEEIGRLSRLVDALLVMARSTDSHPVGRDAVNLADLTREAARTLPFEALAVPRIEAPDEALVRGDEDLLRVAVSNLLDNARKFGAAGASPRVEVSTANGRVSLRVITPGSRISAAERDLLFDRFYRGPESRAGQPGHGLGLSLAQHIARLHDGDVSLASVETEDPCFVLDLPTWRPV